MIAIIDYGMGNLRSVQKGFEKVGVDARVVANPVDVARADGVVLPGVGAFADAVDQLKATGLDRAVKTAVADGRPFLGICLGLQLLFERSFEDGEHVGLGIIAGTVERLPAGVKIPHMGWNQVKQIRENFLMTDISAGADFYFVHSYVVRPTDKTTIVTLTDYGADFASGVARDNVYAFQFHPEKSGLLGLKVLKNFGKLCGLKSGSN